MYKNCIGCKHSSIQGQKDSLCASRWAPSRCKHLWRLVNVAREVLDLALFIQASFSHIKRDADPLVDTLAIGGRRENSMILLHRNLFFLSSWVLPTSCIVFSSVHFGFCSKFPLQCIYFTLTKVPLKNSFVLNGQRAAFLEVTKVKQNGHFFPVHIKMQ